jgi:hypothetical protein
VQSLARIRELLAQVKGQNLNPDQVEALFRTFLNKTVDSAKDTMKRYYVEHGAPWRDRNSTWAAEAAHPHLTRLSTQGVTVVSPQELRGIRTGDFNSRIAKVSVQDVQVESPSGQSFSIDIYAFSPGRITDAAGRQHEFVMSSSEGFYLCTVNVESKPDGSGFELQTSENAMKQMDGELADLFGTSGPALMLPPLESSFTIAVRPEKGQPLPKLTKLRLKVEYICHTK